MMDTLHCPFELSQLAYQKGFREYCFVEFIHDEQGINKYWAGNQNDEAGIPSPSPLQLLNWVNATMKDNFQTRNFEIQSKGNTWYLVIKTITPIVKYQGSLIDTLTYALNYYQLKKM